MSSTEPDTGRDKYKYKSLIQYANIISESMSINQAQALKVAEEFLEEAIRESQKEGCDNLPESFGDILLGLKETHDIETRKYARKLKLEIPKKKEEGVRESDIHWWWNLTDVDRRMIQKIESNSVISLFMNMLTEIPDPNSDEASSKIAAKVRKTIPIYGDPDDTTHTSGEDRPLPFELKERINTYTQRRTYNEPEKFKQDLQKASTFNALIRSEIKAGNL